MLLGTLVVSNVLTHSKIEAYQTSTNDNNVQVESKWPERLLFLLYNLYSVLLLFITQLNTKKYNSWLQKNELEFGHIAGREEWSGMDHAEQTKGQLFIQRVYQVVAVPLLLCPDRRSTHPLHYRQRRSLIFLRYRRQLKF